MHSLYLSHLVEIADGSRHALAINSRICAAFCVLPVYNQLLALTSQPSLGMLEYIASSS